MGESPLNAVFFAVPSIINCSHFLRSTFLDFTFILESVADNRAPPVTEVIPDEANDVSEDGIEVVKEAKINEAEITSDAQFKEYATALLKKAFGADYDEAKAMGVVDGLTAKYDGDYGAMVGALQSSIG